MKMEADLKQALASARAQTTGMGDTVGGRA